MLQSKQVIDLAGVVNHDHENNKGVDMANKANPEDVVPLREALNVEIMINQALIDLLVSKGVITQEELISI